MSGIMRTSAIRLAGYGASKPRIDPWRLATLVAILLMSFGEIACVAKVIGSMIGRYCA